MNNVRKSIHAINQRVLGYILYFKKITSNWVSVGQLGNLLINCITQQRICLYINIHTVLMQLVALPIRQLLNTSNARCCFQLLVTWPDFDCLG